MNTEQKLNEEIETLKYELRLKEKVDGKSAHFDLNIRVKEAELKSYKAAKKKIIEEFEKKIIIQDNELVAIRLEDWNKLKLETN